MRTHEVTLSYVYPPIPIRTYDWACGPEGEVPSHGATMEEAIENYMDSLDEEVVLEIEGPSESIEIHAWLMKYMPS